MHLSAEIFTSIISSLRSDGSVRPHERRVHPRVGLSARLQILLFDDPAKQRLDVHLRDLSTDGICVCASQKLRVGTRFAIRLPADERQPLCAVYHVRHCQRVGPEAFNVGAQLDRILDSNTPTGDTAAA